MLLLFVFLDHWAIRCQHYAQKAEYLLEQTYFVIAYAYKHLLLCIYLSPSYGER